MLPPTALGGRIPVNLPCIAVDDFRLTRQPLGADVYEFRYQGSVTNRGHQPLHFGQPLAAPLALGSVLYELLPDGGFGPLVAETRAALPASALLPGGTMPFHGLQVAAQAGWSTFRLLLALLHESVAWLPAAQGDHLLFDVEFGADGHDNEARIQRLQVAEFARDRRRDDERTVASGIDTAFYRARYPDVAAEACAEHYCEFGVFDLADPAPHFSTATYLGLSVDVIAAGINPYVHYLLTLAVEQRPHAPGLIDWAALGYAPRTDIAAPATAAAPAAPAGSADYELLRDSGLFDHSWYGRSYPDVTASGVDPLSHYLESGFRERRNPNPLFDTAWYLRTYTDVEQAGINPLAHYIRHGAAEGRDPHPEFSTHWYVKSHADLLKDGVNPLLHYLREGRALGLRPVSPKLSYRTKIARDRQEDALERTELLQHVAVMTYRPHFIVLLDGDEEAAIARTRQSIACQIYPAGKIVSAVGDVLAAAGDHLTDTYLVWLRPGDQLSEKALYECASILNADPHLDLVYCDEDRLDGDERLDPFFKPDWSPDYLETLDYVGSAACFRLATAVDFLADADGLYDFTLRFVERTDKIRHVRQTLWHTRSSPAAAASKAQIRQDIAALTGRLRRTGRHGRVTTIIDGFGAYRMTIDLAARPLISIIIPTAGRIAEIGGRLVDLLMNCIDTILARSTYRNLEFVVVDNGDLDHGRLAHVEGVPIRHISYLEPVFNVAKKLNLGASIATGTVLLLLNDDVEPLSPDWIEQMLAQLEKPHVGVVGAKLLYPDFTTQHLGVLLDGGNPDHVRRWVQRDDVGYFFSSCGVRNFVAVTGACMMTPAKLYRGVGGYTEALAVSYNDVDYCLKLREQKYTAVQVPDAELIHFESQSRVASLDEAERDYFHTRWASIVFDPFYNESELTVARATFEARHNERII